MKKYFTIALLTAAAVAFTACEKFLNETPKTSVYEDDAYSSESALEANVYSIYADFSFLESTASFQNLGAAARLVEYTGVRTQEEYTQTVKLTMFSNSSVNQSLYSALFKAVAKCNKLLDRLDGSPVEESYKKEIRGEALFLRSVFYFYLVRMYGDLPFPLTSAEKIQDVYVKRTPYYTIYNQLVEDLQFAYENMRDIKRQEGLNKGKGRVCNMAAEAYLSAVYMQIACILQHKEDNFYDINKPGRTPDFSPIGISTPSQAWEKSLAAAETVISSNVYALEKDFRHLFRWDSANHPEDYESKERILCLQVTPTSTATSISQWTLWANPRGTASNYIHNGNAGRVRASRYTFQKWAELYNGNKETIKEYEVYTSCPDPRFDASFFHTEVWGVPTSGSHPGEMTRTEIYPASSKVASGVSSDPYITKYFSPAYQSDNGEADFYVMRYAEVLLTAAEAAAELNQTGKAVQYVNQLLERARNSVDDTTQSEFPKNWRERDFIDKDDLVNRIIQERCLELAYEGHEWFDTHRRGASWLAQNIAKPINAFYHQPENQECWKSYFDNSDIPENVQELRKSILLAFPEYELRMNTALSSADQNDFFVK